VGCTSEDITTGDVQRGLRMPIPDDLRTERISGMEVRYLRQGTGTPLVLLHTLRTQLEYFAPLLKELDTDQFDVIAPDLPGHGHSSAPRVDYTATYFTDAVELLLDAWDLHDAVVAGESIGASIALGLAARGNARLARVVALNPYDYGRWGGIRRSSALGNVVFTTMLWPGVGALVARVNNKAVLRHILCGGLHDRRNLPDELVDDLHDAGIRPGHARAFRSLMLNWQTWIAARDHFPAIRTPVLLSYGEDDWSRPAERDANAQAILGARAITLSACGHFSSLERPGDIARLIMRGEP
jgi:pimeloyl-ACP methyl ester carboxylesterase